MSDERVFILGAGFSFPCGMPLAADLIDPTFQGVAQRTNEVSEEWLPDFRKRLEAWSAAGGTRRINIEQFFDIARHDIELFRMKQQLSPVARANGDTPWHCSEAVDATITDFWRRLVEFLWHTQEVASTEPILEFSKRLRPSDTVLTFNYDTLLERALSDIGLAWEYPFQKSEAGSIRIAKLHGSLNWWITRRGATVPELDPLFEKVDVDMDREGTVPDQAHFDPEYADVLMVSRDADGQRALFERWQGLSREVLLADPGVAALGSYKPLHQLPGSAVCWFQTAFRALRDASEIFVVGWSASDHDLMAAFNFGAVVRLRTEPFNRVVLVDPNANASDLYGRISRIFGEVTPEACGVQDFDWS